MTQKVFKPKIYYTLCISAHPMRTGESPFGIPFALETDRRVE